MTLIKSNFTYAGQKAYALKKSADDLLKASDFSVANDTQTTVAGNSNAQEAITAARDTAKEIAAAITAASDHIETIAGEFAAFDVQTGQTMFTLKRG